MKFKKPIPVTEIAKKIGAEILGNDELMASGINEIHKVEPGDITFVDAEKYFERSLNSAATIIILNKRVTPPDGKALLVCDNPFEAYDSIVRSHRPFRPLSAMIDNSAAIHPSTIIEPNVIIGPNVHIGKNSYIQANVTIHEYCEIGDHVRIQSGTVIGGDAFYFKKTDEKYQKWRSGGRVIIEDHVDIGNNCTINRGVSGDTIIGEGSKLDALIHVGHGVVIGKHCLFAAQVGIGGKTIIGDHCTFYGQVGIAQNLVLGNHVTVMAQSGVGHNLKDGKTYFGSPAVDIRKKWREVAALKKLPDIIKNME